MPTNLSTHQGPKWKRRERRRRRTCHGSYSNIAKFRVLYGVIVKERRKGEARYEEKIESIWNSGQLANQAVSSLSLSPFSPLHSLRRQRIHTHPHHLWLQCCTSTTSESREGHKRQPHKPPHLLRRCLLSSPSLQVSDCCVCGGCGVAVLCCCLWSGESEGCVYTHQHTPHTHNTTENTLIHSTWETQVTHAEHQLHSAQELTHMLHTTKQGLEHWERCLCKWTLSPWGVYSYVCVCWVWCVLWLTTPPYTQVVKVKRIENVPLWQMYCTRRTVVQSLGMCCVVTPLITTPHHTSKHTQKSKQRTHRDLCSQQWGMDGERVPSSRRLQWEDAPSWHSTTLCRGVLCCVVLCWEAPTSPHHHHTHSWFGDKGLMNDCHLWEGCLEQAFTLQVCVCVCVWQLMDCVWGWCWVVDTHHTHHTHHITPLIT